MKPTYEGLPAPLAPAWLDLSNHDWFPLYFDRLRRSRWWRRASDVARARNIMLWGEAYKAVPAGSLPDDDDELAEAAGYGMDVEAFQESKVAILACWTLCSDGRWHHPTVVEMAQEAWSRLSEKRQKERIKKAEQRARVIAQRKQSAGVPDVEASAQVPRDNGNVPGDNEPVPGDSGDVPGDTPQNPRGHPTQTDRQTDRTVGSKDPVAPASPCDRLEPWLNDPTFEALWSAATQAMRKRTRSKAKAWPEWKRATARDDPSAILAGLRAYLAGDPDVKRTGGPGLHLWLRDRTWEQWAGGGRVDLAGQLTDQRWGIAVEIWREQGRWDQQLGPPPGAPGCRVPAQLLITDANRGAA